MSTLNKIVVWPPEQLIRSIIIILYSPVKLVEILAERSNENWAVIQGKLAIGQAITLAGFWEFAKWALLLVILITIAFWIVIATLRACFKGVSLIRPFQLLSSFIICALTLFFFYVLFAGVIYFFFNIFLPLDNNFDYLNR
jgi:hypothetical protein